MLGFLGLRVSAVVMCVEGLKLLGGFCFLFLVVPDGRVL